MVYDCLRMCTQIMRFHGAPYSRYTIPKMHMTVHPQGEHYDVNGIFVHRLYGSAQFPDVHHLMGTTVCVHQL